MSDHLMLDAATAWLRQECTAAVVRAIDAGASPDALAASFAQLGFDDALRAEADGGLGLGLDEIFPVFEAFGAHALHLGRDGLDQVDAQLGCGVAAARFHARVHSATQC